jgi:hypothetical protein
MQTIQKITRRTTRVELNGREIAILEACLFDGMVRLLKDSKEFDPIEEADDAYAMEARAEADTIRGIQRKLEFARKIMDEEQ